jgi:hypothetical protein
MGLALMGFRSPEQQSGNKNTQIVLDAEFGSKQILLGRPLRHPPSDRREIEHPAFR